MKVAQIKIKQWQDDGDVEVGQYSTIEWSLVSNSQSLLFWHALYSVFSSSQCYDPSAYLISLENMPRSITIKKMEHMTFPQKWSQNILIAPLVSDCILGNKSCPLSTQNLEIIRIWTPPAYMFCLQTDGVILKHMSALRAVSYSHYF